MAMTLLKIAATVVGMFALPTVAPLSAQPMDEATKAWALRRAYQLNGDSMIGCRLRGDGEWTCHSIDLSGEIRESQSGPRPDSVAPASELAPVKKRNGK